MTADPKLINPIPALAVLLVVHAGTAPAAATGSAGPQVSPPPTGRYEINILHAHLYYRVTHLGFSRIVGRFNSFKGILNVDPANPGSSSVEIVIDVASADTNNADLDEFLRSERFFDVKKFPLAQFKSKAVTITSQKTALVTGQLSLHGIERPLQIQVDFNGHGENPFERTYVLGFSAHANFRRSDWDLGAFAPDVGDDVELLVEAEFVRPSVN